MSTKIYDAYRIKKTDIHNIYDVLYEFKQTARKYVSENEKLLKAIHVGAFYYHMLNAKTERDRKEVIKHFGHADGVVYLNYDIKEYLEYSERLNVREIISTDVQVLISLFMDDEYWYLKFFVNGGHMNKLLRELEDKYDFLQDYHYQNQTDPPEDMEWEDFQKRGDKWGELLNKEGNFRNGLEYTVFDSFEFHELMTKNYYIGKEDLFSHLNYEFEPLKFEEKGDKVKVKKE